MEEFKEELNKSVHSFLSQAFIYDDYKEDLNEVFTLVTLMLQITAKHEMAFEQIKNYLETEDLKAISFDEISRSYLNLMNLHKNDYALHLQYSSYKELLGKITHKIELVSTSYNFNGE